MATKPTETLNFEPTTAVAVPAGKQAVGFLPGEKPPAQYLSWLFRTFSRLYNYVKDGNLTGNHTIAGTLDVTGNTTVTGTLGATGPITASAGLTAAANQHVTVSGTGRFKHGTRTLLVPLAAPSSPRATIARFVMASATGGFSAPFSLEVGTRILTIRVHLVDAASTVLVAKYETAPQAGSFTTILASSSSAGNATNQTLTIANINATVTAGVSYQVVVEGTGGGSSSIYTIEIDYDRP